MGQSSTNSSGSVTVSSATTSDHISLVPGREYAISASSAGAFAFDLQIMAGDGVSWDDVYDASGKVTIDSTDRKAERACAGWQLPHERHDIQQPNNALGA